MHQKGLWGGINSSELQKRFGEFLWKCKVALQHVEHGWREAPGWAQGVWVMLCPSRGFLDGFRVWR